MEEVTAYKVEGKLVENKEKANIILIETLLRAAFTDAGHWKTIEFLARNKENRNKLKVILEEIEQRF